MNKPPERPDHDAKCTCKDCMAWAFANAGGCPGGGYTARRWAEKRPQG